MVPYTQILFVCPARSEERRVGHMPSKDNTANVNIPDINIPTWLDLNRLPYNDVIDTKLQIIVKDLCVEDLKLFKPHHIEAFFGMKGMIALLTAITVI